MSHILIDLGSMFWPCWHTAKEHDVAWRTTVGRVSDIIADVSNTCRDGTEVTILADSSKNWRHAIEPEYKSNRKDKPPEALVQLGKARDALAKIYDLVTVSGYEADDLAASAAKVLSAIGVEARLVTADKDWLQLLGPKVRAFNAKHGTMGLPFGGEFTTEGVIAHFGVRPDQIRDMLGIAGDASDCIMGVPGVGLKTAAKLLQKHDTVQAILTWADGDDTGDKLAAKFRDTEIRAMLDKSIRLATLKADAFKSAGDLCGHRASDSDDEPEPSSEFIELGDTIPEPTHRLTVPDVAPGKTIGVLRDSAPPKKEQRTQMETKKKFTFAPATKKKLKCRVAVTGPSKAGKTYTSLAIATHLGGKVAVIDTENRAASKYADEFKFDVLELDSFSPETYVDAIRAAEDAGYDVIVIDSLSHAWIGKNGALAQVEEVKRTGKDKNSFTAWGSITPQHNALIDAIVRSSCHVIATMRLKTEYVIEENDRGKKVPRRIGLAPVQREGMEYEFDLIGEMDQDNVMHIAGSRCRGLSHRDIAKPGADVAAELSAWLDSGVDEGALLANAFERELDLAKSVDDIRVIGDKIASVKDRIEHDELAALKVKLKARRDAISGAAA